MARPLLQGNSNTFSHTAVQDGIITLKTSAAFLTSLGDNLRLPSGSPLPSPVPFSQAALSSAQPSLQHQTIKPISLAQPPTRAHRQSRSTDSNSSDDDGLKGRRSRKNSLVKPVIKVDSAIDEPTEYSSLHAVHLATSTSLRHRALDVLASTVRNQSYTGLRALFTHPATVTLLALSLFLIDRLIRSATRIDINGKHTQSIGWIRLWLAILTTWATLVTISAAIAFLTLRLPHREASLEIDAAWLGYDEVIVAVPSNAASASPNPSNEPEDPEVIGTLVLSWRLREVPGYGKCRKPRRVGRGIIRGWAVNYKDQKQGVGEALLREAARVVTARGGDSLAFAEEHAHAKAVTGGFWGQWAEKRERLARWKVSCIWEECKVYGRRR